MGSSVSGVGQGSSLLGEDHGHTARRGCCCGSRSEALAPPHPLAAELAAAKRSNERRPRYKRLAADAAASVPAAVAQQIGIDVPRTFSALPSGRRGHWGWLPAESPSGAEMAKQTLLMRVLLSHEWRAMGMKTEGSASDDPETGTYVQGLNFFAAMCLGFVGGREEECFWLLLYLTEDVLSCGFFARSPPLLRYHGDKTAAADLVATEARRVTAKLGPQRLVEAVSMLAARCFLSGFVGCLAHGPLLALWEDLLGKRYSAYPRYPLLEWLVGLIRLVEDDLVQIAVESSGPEVGPLFFQRVQQVGQLLPDDWRPGLKISAQRIGELRKVSDEASKKYWRIHDDQHERETHAKSVRDTLGRSSARLLDVVRSAQALGSNELEGRAGDTKSE